MRGRAVDAAARRGVDARGRAASATGARKTTAAALC